MESRIGVSIRRKKPILCDFCYSRGNEGYDYSRLSETLCSEIVPPFRKKLPAPSSEHKRWILEAAGSSEVFVAVY